MQRNIIGYGGESSASRQNKGPLNVVHRVLFKDKNNKRVTRSNSGDKTTNVSTLSQNVIWVYRKGNESGERNSEQNRN